MCAHNGTKLQIELHFLAQNQSLILPAGTIGKSIMPFKVGVNHYYSLSHHDCTLLSQKIFTVAFLLCLFFIPTKKRRVQRSEEAESTKRKIKRERLCIFIYKKHNVSYRYKGPRSGVSQSFMYNRRSNSADSAVKSGSRRKAESTL